MPVSSINPNYLRQATFYALLIFLGIVIFKSFSIFIPALLGAITFYVFTRGFMNYLVYERKWNKNLSAAVLIILSILIIIIPTGLFVNMIYTKIGELFRNSDKLMSAVNKFSENIKERFDFEIMSADNIQKSRDMIAGFLPKLLGSTFNILSSLMIMYFVLYFMLAKSKIMEAWIHEYFPLKKNNVKLLGAEIKKLVISNALGVPLTALMQGIVALIAYLVLGVDTPWFWFVITFIASMFPFIGSALGYVPVSIILLAGGNTTKGIIMLAYGIFIIGLTDNVSRFLFQKKLGNVHPLVTVFGVIIGLNLFGFIGLIFGPILISLFILLIKIYMNEFISPETKSEEQLS